MKSDFFMLGFGSMVGVGWAVSSNHWLAQAGGPWMAFIGFILGTILLIPIGLTYGELMSTIPVSGGVMSYTYAAFGSFSSFLSSWFVVLAYLTILPWEAIFINRILTKIFPVLASGKVLYIFLGSPIYLNSVIIGIIFASLLFLINIKGSKLAAKLQTILSWSIIGIGLLVIILSFIKGDFSNLKPIYKNIGVGNHQNMFTGIMTMIVLVPFFMSGFDTIPQSVGDAHKNLNFKDIGKSLILAIIAAGSFYSLIILSTSSLGPWEEYALLDPPAMGEVLKNVYPGIFGELINLLVLIGTLAGLFTTWNGMFLASSRLIQSMGKSGLIPNIFGKEIKKYKTPLYASILCFIVAAIGPFLGLNFIDPLTNLGSVAFVIGWFLTCLSALKLRKTANHLERAFKIPGGKFTIILGTIISALILILTFIPGQAAFMGITGIVLFFIWLIIGLIFYYFTNGGDKGISEEERSMKILGTKSNDFSNV